MEQKDQMNETNALLIDDSPIPFYVDKSFLTNFLSVVLIGVGYLVQEPYREYILSMGYFALSGAITNWLAIYMLFEKVPGCYGSGVIPARFNEFKAGIERLIMGQFFTRENMSRFFGSENSTQIQLDAKPLLDHIDYDRLFNNLVESVNQTPMGAMLGMFGGASLLEKLKQPFIERTKSTLLEMSTTDEFKNALKKGLMNHLNSDNSELITTIHKIVTARLDELTPELVKEIIQDMIRRHLGWLVVWGGVFGALLGLLKPLMG